MNQNEMHRTTKFDYRFLLFICLVTLLWAVPISAILSRVTCHTNTTPNTSSMCALTSANDTAIVHAAGAPAPADLPHAQDRPESGINWAWLALPAILGMLLITLRRRGGS